MEAQAPASFLQQTSSGPGGKFVNFTTTFQEQAQVGPMVNEGDNFGTAGNQQSRYFMAC